MIYFRKITIYQFSCILVVASTDFVHRLIPPTALRSCCSEFRGAVLGILFVISISCDNNTNPVI